MNRLRQRGYLERAGRVLRRAGVIWAKCQITSAAAAVAFYAVLALAPTLVFVTAVAARLIDAQQSRQLLTERLEEAIGPEAATVAQNVFGSEWYAGVSQQSLLATAPSAVLLLFGSSVMFAQLRTTLNEVFRHEPMQGASWLKGWLIGRLISTAFAVSGGLVLLALLAGSVLLRPIGEFLSRTFGFVNIAGAAFDTLSSYALVATVLTAVFFLLPARRPPVRNLLAGAIASATCFELGRWALSAYVSNSLIATVYGPASSLVAFLLWVYYTTNIVLMGAVLSASLEAAWPRQASP